MYKHHYYQNKRPRFNRSIFGRILLVLFSIIVVLFLVYAIDSLVVYRGKTYPNVAILNQDIGRANKSEVHNILEPAIEKAIKNPILVEHDGWQLSIIPQDNLGASIESEKLINEAYSIGRRGSLFFRIKERLSLAKNNYYINPVIKFEENNVKSFFNGLKLNVEKSCEDAYSTSDRITPARIGIEIDREQLLRDIEKSMISSIDSEGPTVVSLPVSYHDPDVSTIDILNQSGFFQTISNYKTSLSGKEENTLYNIQKAAEEINGVIINPGEILSFNKIVGPAEKEDGYKESTIIANGQFVNGYGGGVCQVSTTLYNAAILANLQIVERYNHSIYDKPTNYVPLGQDAAVFFGYKDLKIKNSLDQRIVVFTEIKSNNLSVTIWGEKMLGKEIKIITQDLKTYDYDVLEVTRENVNIFNFDNNVIQEGVPGYSIKTYRIILDSSGERMEFLSEDRYGSIPEKVLVD